MECIPRTREGGFQHVTSANGDRQGVRLNESEMWIDTLFMTVLFLNRMGQKYGKQEWIDESIKQVLMHIKYLYDTHTGLFFHGWSFNRMDNFGGVFWCRGNSWFTLGILDYLDMFKGTLNQGVKTFILDTYKAQVRALRDLQGEDGLWHTVLDDSTSYEETSGSAAITAGILKGIRMGILDDSYLLCQESYPCNPQEHRHRWYGAESIRRYGYGLRPRPLQKHSDCSHGIRPVADHPCTGGSTGNL